VLEKIDTMKAKRQYRARYQFAGRTTLARDLRDSQTPAEDSLWQLLRGRRLHGFKFRRQHQIGDYIADFFRHEAGLVIECDGDVHEKNESWHHDRTRDGYMISQGLRVLRFPDQQILNNPENVLREIQGHLGSSTGRDVGDEKPVVRPKPSPRPSPKGRGR
jgi:type I restriction enzyme R subunit